MEEEYLSDLSSSYEEEQSLKKIKPNRKNGSIAHSSTNDNNNNNDNDNDNDNDYDNDNGTNYTFNNMNDNNNDNGITTNYNNVFIDPRVREQQELEEAIRLSLLDQHKAAYIIPKYEDNFINQNNRSNRNYSSSNNNSRNIRHAPPQVSNQSNNLQRHHKHRHRNHKNSSNIDDQTANSEVSIEQIILQSKKEEDDTKLIRDFISNKDNLRETLNELPGVDSNDPCFEQFFE